MGRCYQTEETLTKTGITARYYLVTFKQSVKNLGLLLNDGLREKPSVETVLLCISTFNGLTFKITVRARALSTESTRHF